MLGREIKTLLSSYLAAGEYTLQWMGDNNYGNQVSSGTYILTVQAGNKFKNLKMMLLK